MKTKYIPQQFQTIQPKKERSFIQDMKLKRELTRKTLKKQNLQTLAYVKYKHDQIVNIVTSIDELSQMLLDIKLLVNDQSLLINNIIENCEQAEEYTKETVEVLQTAKHLQKKNRIVCFLSFLQLKT